MNSKPIKQTKIVILVGETGAGKSRLGNILLRLKNYFPEFNAQISGTQKASKAKVLTDEYELIVLDTCGFDDNRGKSRTEILREILVMIQDCKQGIDLVLYCMKANDRMKIERIKELGMIFGEGVYNNLAIVRTKMDTLSEEERDYILDEGKDEMLSVLDGDCALNVIKENQILFSDPENSEAQFLTSFQKLLLSIRPYIHPLANINFLKLSSHQECLKIPEFKSLISFNITDLEKNIESIPKGINTLEKRRSKTTDPQEILKIDEKLQKYRKELSQYQRELAELKDLQKNTTFLIELETRERFYHVLTTYSESNNQVSLENDMRELCRRWDQAHGEEYTIRGSYENAIMEEFKTKLPRIIRDRIVVMLQTEMGSVLQDLILDLNENSPIADMIETGMKSGMIVSMGIISGEIIGDGILLGLGEAVLAGVLGAIASILALVFIVLQVNKMLSWQRTEVMEELICKLKPQLALSIREKITDDVNAAIRQGLTNFTKKFNL